MSLLLSFGDTAHFLFDFSESCVAVTFRASPFSWLPDFLPITLGNVLLASSESVVPNVSYLRVFSFSGVSFIMEVQSAAPCKWLLGLNFRLIFLPGL